MLEDLLSELSDRGWLVSNLFQRADGGALPTGYNLGFPYVGVFVNGETGDANS